MTAARDPHRELLATAVAAAVRGGEIIRRAAEQLPAVQWEEKGSPVDFVSAVDRGAEEAIAEIVRARHPEAVVAGEELSPERVAAAGLVFVVDPLDGTTNFLHGYPEYAVSIGVVRDGTIVAGVVLNAASGELFTATAGAGARRNGEPIHVSSIEMPARALIGTGFPFKHQHLLEPYQRQFGAVLRGTSGIRRAGAAALDLADVACGRFDGFWELVLAPWDVAAGILLVREGGGIVTDLAGAPAAVAHAPLVAGNPAIHRWLLDTIQEASS